MSQNAPASYDVKTIWARFACVLWTTMALALLWVSPSEASAAFTFEPISEAYGTQGVQVALPSSPFVVDGHLTRRELRLARPSVASGRGRSDVAPLLRTSRDPGGPAATSSVLRTAPHRSSRPFLTDAAFEGLARYVLNGEPVLHARTLSWTGTRQRANTRRIRVDPRPDDESSQFPEALKGSAIGTVVGGLAGGLLIAAANQESSTDDTDTLDDPQEERARTAGVLGALFVVGGAPVGAVRGADLEGNKVGIYALSGLGELILGGAGIALGVAAGQNDTGKAVGAIVLGAPGVAVGAAGGAVSGAERSSDGALGYDARSDEWFAQPPSVDVHLRPSPSAHVSLFQLNL